VTQDIQDFIFSAEDELLMRFGGERFKRRVEMLESMNTTGEPISSKMFTRL
jgi:preprotein translocase subunit SecA